LKQLAVVLAAILSFALVAPAAAQPFADVPTDHWAYDAIAELAAKGLVEGYPDGSFRGDRAMTRYEMAMVVARLLARIEAIKIPPLPPDLVRRPELAKTDAATRAALTAVDKRLTAKLAVVQRLVAEFRAELAALGVRVTAVEEELAALRARMDNTRTTGFASYRFQFPVAGPGGAGSWSLLNLTHVGRIGPAASATFRLVAGNVVAPLLTPAPGTWPAAQPSVVFFDRAHLDVKWLGLDWRAGRQTYRLGAFSLLFREGWIADPNLGFDGLSVRGAAGPVRFEAAAFRHTAAVDLFMGRGAMAIVPGWTLGVNYYTERHNFTSVTPNIAHTGWSVDLAGALIPGLDITVEYATFTPSAAATQAALQLGSRWDLARLFGMTTYSPVFSLGYKQWGGPGTAVWSPLFPGTGDLIVAGTNFRNLTAWNARLDLTVSPLFRPYIAYETGFMTTTGALHRELEVGVLSTLAPGTTGRFRYQRVETPAGVVPINRYRVEVWYSW
jgi:hypothetical protein